MAVIEIDKGPRPVGQRLARGSGGQRDGRCCTLAEAREGFRQLMADRPAATAVFCGNDVLAFGALLEARRMGLAVPEMVLIVYF